MEGIVKDELEIVCLLATDWCYYEEQAPRDSDFTAIEGVIVGLLIHEDDDRYVLAHQWFPDQDEVRHITVITKSSVQELHRLRVFDEDE